MEEKFFLDVLFDFINESDTLNVADITYDAAENVLYVQTATGTQLKITCEQVKF